MFSICVTELIFALQLPTNIPHTRPISMVIHLWAETVLFSCILVHTILNQKITWSTLSCCSSLSIRQKGHHLSQNWQHRCSFVSTGETTVHWHSEKASIQSLFLPHTLAEWETSDQSLLYYPDAPAPLGNEILYYVHQAMPSSARHKTNGKTADTPSPQQNMEAVGERDAWGRDGYLVG